MFKLNEIKELIKIIDKSTIEQFEIENEGTRLYISKPKPQAQVIQNAAPVPMIGQIPAAVQQPAAPQAAPVQQANVESGTADPVKESSQQSREGLHEITSPMVGTFYAAPSPGADPYVKAGDKVNENTVVCIVEAMKLMNEIEAEVKGEIVEVLVQNAQLVEFGQPLFLVKPE